MLPRALGSIFSSVRERNRFTMPTRARVASIVAFLIAVSACGTSRFHAVEWHAANHMFPPGRSATRACEAHHEPPEGLTVSPPSDRYSDGHIECASSSDCKEKPLGWCSAFRMKGITESNCEYDACRADADCGAGKACTCGEIWEERRCVVATCRDDSECGSGRWCSFSEETAQAAAGYYCHTLEDTCVDRSLDCPRDEQCIYEPTQHRWSCARP